jgi:hypothetical protein
MLCGLLGVPLGLDFCISQGVEFWLESVHGRGLTCTCPFGFS